MGLNLLNSSQNMAPQNYLDKILLASANEIIEAYQSQNKDNIKNALDNFSIPEQFQTPLKMTAEGQN